MDGSIARAPLADFLLLLLLFLLLLRRLRFDPRRGDGGGSLEAVGTGGTVELGSASFGFEEVREGILTSDGGFVSFSVIFSLL